MCVVCVCVYECLASACPFRLGLSHLPAEAGGARGGEARLEMLPYVLACGACVACMCARPHNIRRCEEARYLYQLPLVITH